MLLCLCGFYVYVCVCSVCVCDFFYVCHSCVFDRWVSQVILLLIVVLLGVVWCCVMIEYYNHDCGVICFQSCACVYAIVCDFSVYLCFDCVRSVGVASCFCVDC